MLLALLNSAGWVPIANQTAEVGIVFSIYAAVFGWLTWKQSLVGTVTGFILWALFIVASALLSLREGDFATPLRGWWAIVGQGMLLLNGVRAARYRHFGGTIFRDSGGATESREAARAGGRTADATGTTEISRGVQIGIQHCPSCRIKVLSTPDGFCPACRKAI